MRIYVRVTTDRVDQATVIAGNDLISNPDRTITRLTLFVIRAMKLHLERILSDPKRGK